VARYRTSWYGILLADVEDYVFRHNPRLKTSCVRVFATSSENPRRLHDPVRYLLHSIIEEAGAVF